ncbi:type II membrane protein [Coemansia javaensis]|uniref:Autophagy-related protein 27 n=1 Tax=Coemansia javaensis TaxID=2761396 RepID=A0A9W8LFU8_9FUNG|nr:type II membrane protein [Coemansia javaensis]
MRATIAQALGALAVAGSALAFDCKSARVAGFTYDLSPLAHDVALAANATTPPTVTGTVYTLNPCAPLAPPPDSVPAIDRCPAGAWVCRTVTNYKLDEKPRVVEVGAVAGTGAHTEPALEARAEGSEPPKQVHWKMAGPDIEGVKWAADIALVCARNARNADLPRVLGVEDGVVKLEWAVPAACALSNSGGGDKDRGSEPAGGGGGIFSTLFTIALFLALLYLVVGIMYRYLVVRARGLDLFPNRSFWREFPYLCSDFAQHVWSMAGTRRHDGYSVV